ncbi:MAG: pentapeptide repeat-containing protein [Candidatus Bathyarchaeota archaeon]|nr:pentapeptide repeat-containing protein [Candidatus Bathyarchaeota archaeon]
MVNEEHYAVIKQGAVTWNNWRESNSSVQPDLSEADLSRANISQAKLNEVKLSGANLNEANLTGAYLVRANFAGADLRDADLSEANLSEANLFGADLREANLSAAILTGANLSRTDLRGAVLRGVNLRGADIKGADLSGADISESEVYGVSVWGIKGLENAVQRNLRITPDDEPKITIDNLEVAQFIYLMLHSNKIRSVIDTITSKVVLILGRFTPERKAVLDAIRGEARRRDYLPVIFDFDKPIGKSTGETLSTLAHIAKFVIADLTDANCISQELKTIVPNLPSVPVQPILLSSARVFGMYDTFEPYPWVLNIYRYSDFDNLLANIDEKVILPAENYLKTKKIKQEDKALNCTI